VKLEETVARQEELPADGAVEKTLKLKKEGEDDKQMVKSRR